MGLRNDDVDVQVDVWVSWAMAAELTSVSVPTVEHAVRQGWIKRRPARGSRPTLERASVESWARARADRRDTRRKVVLGTEPAPPGYVGTAVAAARLGVCVSTVSRKARMREIEAIRHGKDWWVEERALEAYAAEEARWITWMAAAALIGCNRHVLEDLVAAGEITTRKTRGAVPSILRESAAAYRRTWQELQEQRAAERQRRDLEQARAHRARVGPPDDAHDWLTPDQAAQLLGLSREAVRQRILREKLPATRTGIRWWIRRDHVDSVRNAAAFQMDRAHHPSLRLRDRHGMGGVMSATDVARSWSQITALLDAAHEAVTRELETKDGDLGWESLALGILLARGHAAAEVSPGPAALARVAEDDVAGLLSATEDAVHALPPGVAPVDLVDEIEELASEAQGLAGDR